ncbi:rod shape-determining protein MreC [[Phormidium ambiguum] IAM M-71]|uniref:Cell shape-determining protein MreC n=1 Tax=[Phormidium ambiguum] IAM M-71 TaxID=454136 RepID=A0A1U7IF01_9CYAN|nr:rod shape-determining protein MreC [Phormidium ambiguum]OKH35581.1 rod shape-determining protein MreC [Phormidium ambiguum IAM M-71]
MDTLRRWWDRNWLQVALIGLVISTAWFARQTQGGSLFEVYQLFTRPFQSNPSKQELLTNAKVVEMEAKLQQVEKENQKLRELLGYVSQNKEKPIAAPIVGRSADHWWQQITLGRGSKDGIKEDFVVTAPGGLVGRVSNVTDRTSRVLLISDPTSRVGVTINRSRFMGIMRGKSGNKAVMQFFERVPDVRRGDVVTTSSASKYFPSGLPVGRVESVNLSQSPAPEAVIVLSAPTSVLEWVAVYPVEENSDLKADQAKSK